MLFWLVFSEKIRLSCFSCVCWLFDYLLWKNVYPYFLPIFIWVIIIWSLSCKSSYMLDTSFLSILFAKIFSHLYFFFFHLLVNFEAYCYKLLWSKISFFFFFAPWDFGVISKNLEPTIRLQKLCLMSFKIFIVLALAFRSLMHFELLFVYSMR